MAGARAVQQAILNASDSEEFTVAMVWVKVMPTDDAYAAALQAKLMPDRRVTHFADPEGYVGTNLVQELITSGPAWDTQGPRKNNCVVPRASVFDPRKAPGARNSRAISGFWQRSEGRAQATEYSSYSCADPYLFYDDISPWGDTPPTPLVWFHQLVGGKNADPSRFRTGDELKVALTEALHEHLESASA